MIRVKICGITSLEDALMAVEAGADALGFVFHEQSPRHVTPEEAAGIIAALPPFIQTVGLFVNRPLEFVNETAVRCRIDLVQLHGDEPPEFCDAVERRVIKAFRVQDITSLDPIRHYRVAAHLLDAYSPTAYGGTGLTFNWDIAKSAKEFGPVILAGGLTPDNVREAVEAVMPYAVDVSGGVESSPGRKDGAKVREFIRRAKG
ncbi:phosphoribosylanthranilate isomerase [Geobacter hydrogenophilus]|uniref:N-(5'-phosphoribosyl)anthranilate isomerase n=1 Tax=Geobacter hydrogenophilus TaxID=40983 RepID=A0A9W6G3M6_9BACT|nr:phosphoribosylanthranilate isomerase [Geobacter hydrogenophilus]MBT0892440.1 phosphoribosylanthranilate isomerase [Geobacter hydrogenophilus]GLI39836.1 N-(5'-phosphoribosyl)anthranilate isomerase [Geobacter hydrogenophilus]